MSRTTNQRTGQAFPLVWVFDMNSFMRRMNKILENPLLRKTQERQRAQLRKLFPELASCPHQYFLALRKYIASSPERFYSESVYLKFFNWLRDRDHIGHKMLQSYLSAHIAELNRAFYNLQEINRYVWHDHLNSLDDYEMIRLIDQQIHPTYLKLIEAVLAPILRIVAHFLRVDQGKGTDGLDVWPVIQEIEKSDLSEAIQPYRRVVRNGIAHGGITFLDKQIRYTDKGNEETYDNTDVIRNFDDLLDTCNALVLGLSIFLLAQQGNGYELPGQLLFDELKEETMAPWWEIVGCIPSELAGLRELIIYARPRTSDYRKVQLSAFQSGVLAELFAPDYDRYFFSLHSENSFPGWVAFDGKKLRELRSKPKVLLFDYQGVIENDLIFYVPRHKFPRFVHRFGTLLTSIRLHWPLAVADFRKQLGWADIRVREARVHRNGWRSVLNGIVCVANSHGEIDQVNQDLLRKSCRRIIRKALLSARRRSSRMDVSRYLTLGFAHISVFQKDYRRRRLNGFGLGKDLVCTIQVQGIRRVKSPDIIGSTIEQKGKYRLAWNRAWLEDKKAIE
jgi:hypothetical protein